MLPDVPQELCSWKEIASYLGVSVKTAQVWERDRALPVHRVPGPRAHVRAFPAQLDAWKVSAPRPTAQQPLNESIPGPLAAPSPGRWLSLSLVVLFVTGVALAVGMVVHRPILTAVSLRDQALVGLDASGNALWRHEFASIRADAYADGERRSWVGDLDGQQTVLFVPVPAGLVQEPVPLLCLDNRGRERWRFNPGKTVQRGSDVFEPPFVVRQFAVIGDKIVVTSHHHLYYPSQVAVLDANGNLLREYWHPGHLNVLSTGTYQGKKVLFLGGINNARHAATLVVLDPEQFGGAALEHDRPVFDRMSAPAEVARILFPRSALNPTDPYNVVVQLIARTDKVIVDVHERLTGTDPPSIQYHLNEHLDLDHVVVSDIFLSEFQTQTKHAFTTADEQRLTLTRVR